MLAEYMGGCVSKGSVAPILQVSACCIRKLNVLTCDRHAPDSAHKLHACRVTQAHRVLLCMQLQGT